MIFYVNRVICHTSFFYIYGAQTRRATRGVRGKSERGLARRACLRASNCMVFARNGHRPTEASGCDCGSIMCRRRRRPISLSPSKRRKEGMKEGVPSFCPSSGFCLSPSVPPSVSQAVPVGRSIGPEKNERRRKLCRDKTVVMWRGEGYRDKFGYFTDKRLQVHSGTNFIHTRSLSLRSSTRLNLSPRRGIL